MPEVRRPDTLCSLDLGERTDDFVLKCCILKQISKMAITGSYPWADTLWRTSERGLVGLKTGGLRSKDRRVQTIICEITLHPCPLLKRFHWIRVSTPDRNRQNPPRKWGYPVLGGSGQYLPVAEGWNTSRHDCRYPTSKRKQKAGNHVEFREQLCRTLLSLAMPPTNLRYTLTLSVDDYV